MTSPDGYTPDGAVSETGLSVFAKKTQADWQAEQLTSARSRWLGAQTGFDNVLSKVPIIGDIIEILTGIPDANPNDLGSWVNNLKHDVGLALGGLARLIAGVGGTIVEDVTDFVTNTWNNVKKGWENFWDGTFGTTNTIIVNPLSVRTAASYVSSKANTADATASRAAVTADTAQSNLSETNKAVYNGFYDSGGTGTSTQVQTTISAIKTKLTSGYTLQSLTTSGTWSIPDVLDGGWATTADAPKEFYVIAFGAGGGGAAGQKVITGTATGGGPGIAGHYAAIQIDATTLPFSPSTVSYTVAPATAGVTGYSTSPTSSSPTAGSQSSFGSYLTTSATTNFISTALGYTPADSSAAGDGGVGGNASSGSVGSGSPGVSTLLASGGKGGSTIEIGDYNDLSYGSPGSDAALDGYSRSGGAGGGGGRGNITAKANAYAGGNGGFPGGGGGGGGAVYVNGTTGSGGTGGQGVIILLWK